MESDKLPCFGDIPSYVTLGVFWRDKARKCLATGSDELSWLSVLRTKMTPYDIRSQEHAWLLSFLGVEKPSMFLAPDVIKRHFGVHTESQESSSLKFQ